MANPRRSSFQFQQQNPTIPLSDQGQQPSVSSSSSILRISLSSLALFLKKPHAFPFLLSIFVFLTWLSLRFQHPGSHHRPPLSSSLQSHDRTSKADADANLVRFSAVEAPSLIAKDGRGWLLDPVVAARDAGIQGGAKICASVHLGEIRPGGVRGNHRHHDCNETFIIWGAEMKFRLENPHLEGKGYAEVLIGAYEVVVAASAAGTAHALINVDRVRTTYFLGCQDCIIDHNNSSTDYHIWKDL